MVRKKVIITESQLSTIIKESILSNELEKIKEDSLNDGTFMKAPNGNGTNLTESQWLQVRTVNFKIWFGDWENDRPNSSKVLDENGEPLVVYHGSPDEFETFDLSKKRYTVHEMGIFFTTSEKKARRYGSNVMPVFLNIRHIGYSHPEKSDTLSTLRKRENDVLKDTSYDGVKFITIDKEGINTVQYAVKSPNQIKSAIRNNGNFDISNDTIFA